MPRSPPRNSALDTRLRGVYAAWLRESDQVTATVLSDLLAKGKKGESKERG